MQYFTPPLIVFRVVSLPAKIINNQEPSKNSWDNFLLQFLHLQWH